jgi:hypothetical protein
MCAVAWRDGDFLEIRVVKQCESHVALLFTAQPNIFTWNIDQLNILSFFCKIILELLLLFMVVVCFNFFLFCCGSDVSFCTNCRPHCFPRQCASHGCSSSPNVHQYVWWQQYEIHHLRDCRWTMSYMCVLFLFHTFRYIYMIYI